MPDARNITLAVDIDAPIDVAWRIMTDFSGYPLWNPFVVGVEASAPVRVGTVLSLSVRMPNKMRTRSQNRVTVLSPPRDGRAVLEYVLTGPTSWLVRARRTQTLTATSDYRCRYETSEDFSGRLRHLLPFRQIEEGTLRHADGLKWAVEGAFIQFHSHAPFMPSFHPTF